MKIVARDVKYDSNVMDFASRIPVTLTDSERIARAIKLMISEGVDNIPIVDAAGKATAAVLRTLDIIHFLAEAFPEQVLNLPPQAAPDAAQTGGWISDDADQGTKQTRDIVDLDRVTIRFAGDSGDGMQLAGTQFTKTSAVFGNDISTFPDFPAEIRAPQGSLPGVSGFQVSFSSYDIYTPGDAARRARRDEPGGAQDRTSPTCRKGGILIVNADEFNDANLKKAGYAANPLDDGSLSAYRVYRGADRDAERARAQGQRPHRQCRSTAARTSSRSA